MNKQTNDAFKKAFLAAQNKTAQKIEDSKQPANSDKTQPGKDSTPKEYDNLKDIEQAAKDGKTISLLNLSNLVNQQPKPEKPKVRISPEQFKQSQPAPQPTASQMPELSKLTFADLLPDATPQFCAPQPFTMPTVKPQPQQDEPALKIVDYSDRSFAIVTATKPSEEILNILRQHGTFNKYLKCGKGWIFSKRHLATVKQKLGL